MQKTLAHRRLLRLSVPVGLVLLAVVLAAGVPGRMMPTSKASTPTVQITPNQGHIHDLVVISGTGFRPGEDVFFSWGVHPFWGAVADASGNYLTAPHPVQWFAAYSSTITAIGHTSGLKATTTFTLLK
ncbi:MAG: hypothetical protein WBL63_21640 [Candidatus Acidiferrum sp.]